MTNHKKIHLIERFCKKIIPKERVGHSSKRHTLFHIVLWILLVGMLFYGLHCYFKYREQLLDKRLEMISNRAKKMNAFSNIMILDQTVEKDFT